MEELNSSTATARAAATAAAAALEERTRERDEARGAEHRATEKGSALAREQMESVGHAAAAELQEAQAKQNARLADARAKMLSLEEELSAANARALEAKREAEEMAKLTEVRRVMRDC